MPLRRLSIPALGLAALVATAAPAYADRAAARSGCHVRGERGRCRCRGRGRRHPRAVRPVARLRVAVEGSDSGIVLLQRPGNDGLSSDGGQDALEGEEGDDVLVGERQTDTLSGGDGNDVLFGGPASDFLAGGDGTDSCDGGAAEDVVTGCETTRRVP